MQHSTTMLAGKLSNLSVPDLFLFYKCVYIDILASQGAPEHPKGSSRTRVSRMSRSAGNSCSRLMALHSRQGGLPGASPPSVFFYWNSHESQVQGYNNSINRNCHYAAISGTWNGIQHFPNFWAQKLRICCSLFLGPEIAEILQFLSPEIAVILQSDS